MPPRPHLEGAIKVVYIWGNADGEQMANIFYVANSGTANTTTDFDAIMTGMTSTSAGSFLQHYSRDISTNLTLLAVDFVDLGVSHLQGTLSPAWTGQESANALPPQTAVCLSWLAAGIGWRGGRPRTYMPGVPTGYNTAPGSSRLTSTATSAYQLDGRGMISAVQLIGTSVLYKLGLVSYFNKAVNPTPPHLRPTPLFYAFIDLNVHSRLDSQRRRSGKEVRFP